MQSPFKFGAGSLSPSHDLRLTVARLAAVVLQEY